MENKTVCISVSKILEVRRRLNLTSNFYFLVLIVIIGINFPSNAQSLEEYLQEAAENNPGLKSSYLEFEAAMQKTAQVKALPDLSLSFGYFVSPVETRVGPQRAKFSLVQMFPWFGTNGSKAEVSELNAQASYQNFLDRRNQLFYQVKTAYYPIYELQWQIVWKKENLDILRTYKRLATTSFSNGKGAMVDVIRVDIMIDEAETGVKLLEEKLTPLEVVFNRLLNRSDSLGVEVEESLSVESNAEFSMDSISINPALEAIDLKIKGAEASEIQAGKQGMPTFGVGVDYVIVDKRMDMELPDNGKNIFMPMVTMSLPIFRGKYKTLVKESQLTQEALKHKKQELENNLVSSFELSRYDFEKSVSMYQLYQNQIKKTQQAIDLLETSYANDGKDFEEILRMEQQLLNYRIAIVGVVKDYYLAEAKLDYITAKSE